MPTIHDNDSERQAKRDGKVCTVLLILIVAGILAAHYLGAR